MKILIKAAGALIGICLVVTIIVQQMQIQTLESQVDVLSEQILKLAGTQITLANTQQTLVGTQQIMVDTQNRTTQAVEKIKASAR